MNYANENTTSRAQESTLWPDLESQQGKTLPYLLERYLLLENWRLLDRLDEARQLSGGTGEPDKHDMQFLHLLVAELTTVVLSQEERIKALEGKA